LRNEEGKFLEVHGFKAVVPVDYDETKFLGLVSDILMEGNTEFVRSREKNSGYYHADCENDWCLEMDKLDDIREVIEDADWYLLTDKLFESAIKFIEYLVCDISIDRDNNQEYLILVDESDMYNKLDMAINDAELDEWQAQECYDDLIDWFLEEFGDSNKADIVKEEIHAIQYYNTSLCLKLCDSSNHVMFKTLLWASDMVKWWRERLDDLVKMGAKEYFGFEEEEETE
jgi:hypothetical protein